MKIIFLDIDGVLNGYNYWNTLGWKLVCKTKIRGLCIWYRKATNPFGIHKRKVKRLSKIVKATGAKIVLSSSWRFGWWKTPYEEQPKDHRQLTDLFNKYNIEVIDITPRDKDGRRDKEILSWLSVHESEVDKFIILDDENSFLRLFDNDERFIQTSSVHLGVMICGHDEEDTGLKNKHIKEAIRILNS